MPHQVIEHANAKNFLFRMNGILTEMLARDEQGRYTVDADQNGEATQALLEEVLAGGVDVAVTVHNMLIWMAGDYLSICQDWDRDPHDKLFSDNIQLLET